MCWAKIGERKTFTLVDSGADISILSKDAFNKIAPKHVSEFSTENCTPLQSVSGHELKNFGTAVLNVKMSRFSQPFRFQIIDGLKNDCLLGNDFLTEFGVKLDFGKKTMNIDDNIIPLRPQRLTCKTTTGLIRVPHKVTISAQSYIEISATVNRAQLIGQDCEIQPLSNAPILGDEPGLCLAESVAHVSTNRRIRVLLVNTTGRSYTLPPRSVIGLAEVIDSDACVSSVEIDDNRSSETETEPRDPLSEARKADLSHMTDQQRKKLQDILDRNADLFAKSDCDLGSTDLVKVKIDTGDHPPVKQNPYRLPFSQRQTVQDQINDMLKAGIIEPSRSPWASPIVIVSKKDGTKRFCIDLRKVNKVTVPYSHPLPRIDDILASLGGSQYFTCLDLKSGYWQIAMDEDSKEKTAFTCFLGLFHFLKLPFGLCSAGSYFSELMNKVLSGIQHKFTIAYLDDIIIYSKTFDEHLVHIETVFARLRGAGLKLKMSKCEFLKQEVKYLGYVISANGIKTDPEKVSSIQKLHAPSDVKGVRSFLGMCSYYRRFIPNFSQIAKPLTELTKKNRNFVWTSDCQKAFDTLRKSLTEAPVLAYPDLNKPYKLYTDASNHAIGAALVQETEMGERVIQYLSHQLNETQQRWPIIEKECYAIVYAVQKFRPYLLGAKFTILTDHKPLKHLFTSEMRNAKIQRWAIILSEYGCEDIVYISGRQNVVADGLSRLDASRVGCHSKVNDVYNVSHEDQDSLRGCRRRNDDLPRESSGPSAVGGLSRRTTGKSSDLDNFRTTRKSSSVNDAVHFSDSVNIVDSDKAPDIQFETEVKKYDEPNHREKFREFLEGHPDFPSLQADDSEIKRILDILNDPNHPNYSDLAKHYVLEDRLLFRISDPTTNTSFCGLQLVIPNFLRKPVIEEIHSGYFGGHLGIDKTYDKLRSRYYWSGMYRDVVHFLKTCVACNMRKLRREKPLLQAMPIPKYPFEQIAIDTAGPFPESFQGNRYIVNVIDLFSGWPESFATNSKSAETVAQILLEHIIPRHACPRVIVSDNGTEFCNAVIDQISAFFNIKHIRTSVYHPQSNGKCERYNRVQNDMLAKLVDPSQRDWDTKIPSILSAYRTAKNESTGYSPFFLLFGRDPILPLDSLLSPKYRYHGDEYVPTMLENLHNAYDHVRHNLSRSHERNKFYYDRNAKPTRIQVGDMVYFRDPAEAVQGSSKLASRWRPFYRVIKAFSDVTFMIKNQLTGETKTVNVQNLRLADPDTIWENVSDEPSHINSKYEARRRSNIPVPVRVQPSRQSKFSAAPPDRREYYSESDSSSEPDHLEPPSFVAEPPSVQEPSTSREIPDEIVSEPPNLVDEDDLPLAELQRRWREQIENEEENLPLADLARRQNLERPSDPVNIPVKRPLDTSDPDSDLSESARSPPTKFSCHELPDSDSGSSSEGLEVDACVNSTNTKVDKSVLLREMMNMQSKVMAGHQSLMQDMIRQLEKL